MEAIKISAQKGATANRILKALRYACKLQRRLVGAFGGCAGSGFARSAGSAVSRNTGRGGSAGGSLDFCQNGLLVNDDARGGELFVQGVSALQKN